MFRLPVLCCKHLYNLTPPPYLLGEVLSRLLEMLPPRPEVLKIPTKYNITLNF